MRDRLWVQTLVKLGIALKWAGRAIGLSVLLLFLASCGLGEPATLIPTARPVDTATPTATPVPPTETPEPTFTWTATATNTATPTETPTETATVTPTPTATATNTPVPPTATLLPTNTATLAPSATFTPEQPTETPLPSPTASNTPLPPEPTATPAPTSPPPNNGNYLPNPSFEEGWYNLNGIPELQVPNRWILEWQEGTNPLDPDSWNEWVRPETRLLSKAFLPANEHDLFIWEGNYTVKIFKGLGAINYRLLTDVYLEPGVYTLTIRIFPDLVVGYNEDGSKIWAPDPLSGEVRLIAGSERTGWMLPTFGTKNKFQFTFTVSSPGVVRVGMGARGRWAIENNGWFMDNWSLTRVE